MAHSYTQLLYHMVFSTHERRPFLHADLRSRIFEYLAGAIRSEGGHALLVGGVEDHVHLLVRLRQDRALSDVVRDLKANSSKWIHQTFVTLADFAWQSGYGAFSVSRSQAPRVRRYIAQQEQHHRRLSFQEEFVQLLNRHGIEFDEAYLGH